MRVDDKDDDPVFAIPIEAIKKSTLEVLTAWKFGRLPDGEFSAAELAPFHVDLSLKEKSSESHQRIPFSNIALSNHCALSATIKTH